MTEQATTASEPNVEPQVTDHNGTPNQEPAQPDQPANPETSPEGDNLQKEIETAEKRLNDKEAYLAELRDKLSDYDSNITKTREELKREAERLAAQNIQQPGTPQFPDPTAEKLQAAASELGITGEEFLDLLKEDPNRALTSYGQALEQRIMQKIPDALHQSQVEAEMAAKLNSVRSELGEDFGLFVSSLGQYRQRGLNPSPDHILNELRYGNPEQQRKLMEYGFAMLQHQRAQQQIPQQPAQNAQQERSVPIGTQPFPMAPGRGANTTPQSSRTQRPTGSQLPETWNM